MKPGQVLVQLDTVTLESQLAEANASVQAAEEKLAVARASIVKQKSEIELADVEAERVEASWSSRAPARSASWTCATARWRRRKAGLAEAQAMLRPPRRRSRSRGQNAATIQTRIDDATLRSPVTGRVLYRLAEPGEVLAPGGKALTLVNLEDVYMEIFLPSEQAAAVKIGAEGRDHRRLRAEPRGRRATSASSRRRRSSRPSRSRPRASARS